jgi:hypothetical protein
MDEFEKTTGEEMWNLAVNRLDSSHFNYTDDK